MMVEIHQALIVEPDNAGGIWQKRLCGAAEHWNLPRVPFETGHDGRVDDPRIVRTENVECPCCPSSRELDCRSVRKNFDVDLSLGRR